MKPTLREDMTSVIAIVIGMVTSAGLTMPLLRERGDAVSVEARPVEMVPTVVAARDLPVGTIITASDVRMGERIKATPAARCEGQRAAKGRCADAYGFATIPQQVVGIAVDRPLRNNEPVHITDLRMKSVVREGQP